MSKASNFPMPKTPLSTRVQTLARAQECTQTNFFPNWSRLRDANRPSTRLQKESPHPCRGRPSPKSSPPGASLPASSFSWRFIHLLVSSHPSTCGHLGSPFALHFSCASSHVTSAAYSSATRTSPIPYIIPSILNTDPSIIKETLAPIPIATRLSPLSTSLLISNQRARVPPAQHGQIFCALPVGSQLSPQLTPYSRPTPSLQGQPVLNQ